MKKKIFSIALILILLLSSLAVYGVEVKADAPENVVSNEDVLTDIKDSAGELKNTVLVDKTLTDSVAQDYQSNDSIMPISDMPEHSYNETTNKSNTVVSDENVTLKNKSFNNLFVFAQNADLSDIEVAGDIFVFAEKINISNVSIVNGVVVLAAQNIDLNMLTTEGNIYAAAEYVNATIIARDLFVAAADIKIDQESQIGNIYNLSDCFEEDEVQEVVISTKDIMIDKIYSVLAVVVKTAFVCGFILLFTAEFVSKTRTDENIAKYLGLSVLKGIGWAVIIPAIVIILCCTGIAVGVAFATLALYVIIFWASVPFVSIAIMNALTKQEDTKWKKYGLTLCIAFAIAVLGKLPAIGGLVTVLVGFAGMGIVIGSLTYKCKCCCKKESEVVETKIEEKVEEVKEDKTTEEDK